MHVMSVSRVFVSFLSLCALAVSCVEEPDASLYHAPEILDTRMVVNESDVTLSCKVSRGDNISKCGFYFGTGESDMKEYVAELPESEEFSLNMSGLTFGVRYYYRSFVSGGRDSRMSDIRTMEIDQRLPYAGITSLKVEGPTSIVCEYSVSGSFSGDLFFRGLCWNESGSPDVQLETKTLDGTEYGSLTIRLDGFEIGKTYCFRAYAVNTKGIAYSDEVKVTVPILFEDQTLYNYLLERYDEDSDGIINLKEAAKVTKIDIVSDNVFSLDGLAYMPNLDTLRCRGVSYDTGGGSGNLTEVDLSHNPALSYLDLSCNKLRTLDLSSQGRLRHLFLAGNRSLGSQVLSSGLPFLSSLLTLDISGCPAMDPYFLILPALEEFHYDAVTGLSGTEPLLRNVKSLRRLYAGDALKDDDKIYLAQGLELLDCSGSRIGALDISYNHALKTLNVNNCARLADLDVCVNPPLSELSCLGSGVRTLYLLEGQRIDGVNVNLDKGRSIPEGTEIVYALRIPDKNFNNYLLDFFDTDYNSFVSVKEASVVEEMVVAAADYPGITSLRGIGMFTSLKILRIPGQTSLTELDLSNNHFLTELQCDGAPLMSLNLDGCVSLRKFFAQATALESISLLPSVEEAYLSWSSGLKSLNLSGASGLRKLSCDNCSLETLDISHCPSIESLDCTSSSLKTLYLTRKQKSSLTLTSGGITELVLTD